MRSKWIVPPKDGQTCWRDFCSCCGTVGSCTIISSPLPLGVFIFKQKIFFYSRLPYSTIFGGPSYLLVAAHFPQDTLLFWNLLLS